MPEAWGWWGIVSIKLKPSQKQISTVPQNCTGKSFIKRTLTHSANCFVCIIVSFNINGGPKILTTQFSPVLLVDLIHTVQRETQ